MGAYPKSDGAGPPPPAATTGLSLATIFQPVCAVKQGIGVPAFTGLHQMDASAAQSVVPDRDAMPCSRAATAWRTHPAFRAAVRAMMRDVVGLYEGNRILNQVLNDRGRVVFGMLALYLHYTRDPDDPASGLSAARLRALCAETGLCSRGRATAMLLLMRYAGYLVPAPRDEERERHRLVPTERLIESQRARIACQLKAMSRLAPDGVDGLAHLHREEFLAAMAREFGNSFRSGYRLLDASPALYPLAERNAGMMILFSLYLAATDEDGTVARDPIAVSISDLSRRFTVSRPHVLGLLRDAERLGLLTRRDDGRILVGPQLVNALDDFVAGVFRFLAGCVRAALNGNHVRRGITAR